MDISIVGAGRAGTAVAVLWHRAGHRIVAVSGGAATAERAERHLPGVPVLGAAEAARDAELVVIGVPDDLIAATVQLGADDDEGSALAERLARDLGGRPFRLPEERRAVYHAAAVFASNYLVAATGVAEVLLEVAGVPDPIAALTPLQQATLANIARSGPADALTGPAVRGDTGTIERNLQALAASSPWAVDAYVELARVALDLGVRGGRLSPDQRAEVDEVLARWT